LAISQLATQKKHTAKVPHISVIVKTNYVAVMGKLAVYALQTLLQTIASLIAHKQRRQSFFLHCFYLRNMFYSIYV